MHCPTLTELPPPPPGKTGWPWTEESPQYPEMMFDGSPWPRVSIVTPSYNQAQFIEETIRSVLLQGYPNLEYIIIDGGSTDGSVEIIKKYEPWLAYWVSERDRGQSHAINKGWQRSTGEILAWLNSDDLYTASSVGKAVDALQANPTASLVYSDCFIVDAIGKHLRNWVSQPFDLATLFSYGTYILQQTTFIRRHVLETVGWLDESLQMIMDTDLFIRIGLIVQSPKVYLSGTYFAKCREHSSSKTKTQSEYFCSEALQVWDRVFSNKVIPEKVAAVRSIAYSIIYFNYAVTKVQRGQGLAAIRYLLMALYIKPKYVAGRPLDAVWVLKEVAMGPVRRMFGSQTLRGRGK